MSTIVRPLNPGETPHGRQGLQDEFAFYTRVYIGQIESVDVDNGLIKVSIFGLGAQLPMDIPIHGMSKNRTRSSWIRYMPQKGDCVKIGWGPDRMPEVLGYAVVGDNPKDTGSSANQGLYLPRIGGYKEMRALKERSDADETPLDDFGTPVTLGLRDFIPLAQGEWDMRSSGGAYINGSQFGVLTLSGGQNEIIVNKPDDEIDCLTQLYKFDAGNDSFIRLGDIKRQLNPADPAETLMSPTIGGVVSTREYHLQISQVLGPTGETIRVYNEIKGDVRDDSGVPITLDAIPLVSYRSASTSVGTQIFAERISQAGDVEIENAGTISLKAGPVVLTTYAAVRAEALNTWLTTQLSVLTAFGPSGPAVQGFSTDLAPPGTDVGSSNVQIS